MFEEISRKHTRFTNFHVWLGTKHRIFPFFCFCDESYSAYLLREQNNESIWIPDEQRAKQCLEYIRSREQLHRILDKKHTQNGRITAEKRYERCDGENELRRIMANSYKSFSNRFLICSRWLFIVFRLKLLYLNQALRLTASSSSW